MRAFCVSYTFMTMNFIPFSTIIWLRRTDQNMSNLKGGKRMLIQDSGLNVAYKYNTNIRSERMIIMKTPKQLIKITGFICLFTLLLTTTVLANVYSPGDKITINASSYQQTDSSWVGFYKLGAADKSFLSYKYIKGLPGGQYTVEAPKDLGAYEFRFFKDNGYIRIGTSPTYQITQHTPTITVSTSNAKPEQTITASYANAPSYTTAWIGFYKAGSADTSYKAYEFLKGSSGQYSVKAPKEAGQYEFRLFLDNGYTRLASSQLVTVSADTPTVPVPTTPPKPALPTTTITQPEVFASGIRIGWSSKSSAIGYRLFRSTQSGSLGLSVTDFYLSGTRYADVNVSPNTTYYYTVKEVLQEANPYQNIEEKLGATIATYTVQTGNTVYKPGVTKNFLMLQLDNPYLTQNGVIQEIDPGRGTVPIIISGRTMVPIRAVVEAMGGSSGWENNTQKITLTARGNVVEMWIDRTNIRVNGIAKTMDVAPTIRNARTYVPLRFAAENLNCKIDWINSSGEAVIVYEN